MNEKDQPDKGLDSQYWDDMIAIDVASMTECTGMIPTPPLTDDEVNGYSGIFHMPQQKAETAQKADSPAEQEKNSQG
jgi:hypothetical protein